MPVQHRDFIATDIINPRLESFRDKFRLHEIHPARAKTVSFRATVLLFAVSVPFQPRPARFERNEESDGPLGRRRGRRRPRKLVVSIRVWDAARTLDSRSFVLFFCRSSRNRWIAVEGNDTDDRQCGYDSIVRHSWVSFEVFNARQKNACVWKSIRVGGWFILVFLGLLFIGIFIFGIFNILSWKKKDRFLQ